MRYISSLCFALLFPLLGFSQFMESYTMTKTDKAGGAGSYHRKYYYVDFDLDGTMDVVSNAQPSYYKGLGDGHFERIPLNLTGGNTIELAPMIVCDFDGDGDIDLYVDNDLFLNDGALNLQFYQGNYTEDPETVFAVDLFGDSKLEMLSAEGSSSSNNLVLYHSTDQLLDHDTVLVNGMFDVDRYEMLDLDDDDDLDILCWVDDDFGHLMNLGDGQFGPLTSMNNGQAVTGDILRFDFDNDGLKDMVWRRSNAVGWLRNLGAGNYANSATITTAFTASGSGNNYHAHNCDCDEDGLEEIYFDGGQGNMYKLSQDGVGGYVLNQIFTTGLDDFWKWYFEDMDMDGDIDILIFTDFNFLICHNEAGSFSNPMNLNNNLPGLSLSNDVPDRLIDLTGDGFLDIPIWVDHAFNSPTINEHTRAIVPGPLYNKAFALTAQTMNYGFYGAHFLDFDFGDLDGDGTCEMVVAGQRELAYVLHPDSSGNYNFSHRQMLPDVESLSTRNVRFADMNGDGRLDIVSRHPSPIDNYAPKTLGIMFQNEDGSFEKEYMGPTYSNYFASSVFQLVDIDLDGDIDICYQNKIRLNNGDGTFGTMQNLNTGISNSDTDFTAMGDFNGDGLLDLVYTKKNPNANNIKYFINQGNAVFDTGVNLVLPESTTGPETMKVGDLNGDGFEDVVVDDVAGQRLFMFPAVGDGTFGSPVEIHSGNKCAMRGIADWDGDDDLDIFVTSFEGAAPDSVVVILNDGNAVFTEGDALTSFRLDYEFQLKDVNGDGRMEVVEIEWSDEDDGLDDNVATQEYMRVHFSGIEICGCTDALAVNYNPLAGCDDGSCTYPDCVGDFDNNGAINTNDLLLIMSSLGCTEDCGEYDMDLNGAVNISDLLAFLTLFGTACLSE